MSDPAKHCRFIDRHQHSTRASDSILRNRPHRPNSLLGGATMTVMGVTKFERFFRAAAELNVDKQA
jgi:hypothetical protein